MPAVTPNTAQAREQKQAQEISDVWSQIRPVSQLALDEPARFLIYGNPKEGKTTFCASSGLKTLLVEFDPGGLEPLSDEQKWANVDAIKVTRWEQMNGLFWGLYNGQHQYELFAWDTTTLARTLLLRMVMDNETKLDSLTPQTTHHQKVARILNNEILRWCMLPYHAVFTAHQRNMTIKREELGGEEVLQRIVPDLSASPLGTLLGAVGTIGRLYTKEVPDPENPSKIKVQRRLLLSPSGGFYAGTRIRGLPKLMAEPTLDVILAARQSLGEALVADDPAFASLAHDLLDEEYAERQSAHDAGAFDTEGADGEIPVI